MIRALIFDFDGLVLDTETPEYIVLQEIYRDHGQELAVEDWGRIVGGSGAATFDAVEALERLTGRELDRAAINARWRREADARIAAQPVLPGVREILDGAREIGLRLAVASSSPHIWVDGHLARLRLMDYFEVIKCAEDVSRVKPDPELYLAALSALGVQANEAVVFEDSPNGVRAGRAAGIFTIAVPNPLTAQLKVDGADLMLASLADISLEELLTKKIGVME